MIWLWVVVLVLVIGAAAVVAAGRGEVMADVYEDRPDTTLERGRRLSAADVRAVRFTTAVRGYRMDEVDAFVARMEAELLSRGHRDEVQDDDDRAGDSHESLRRGSGSDLDPAPGRTAEDELAGSCDGTTSTDDAQDELAGSGDGTTSTDRTEAPEHR